MRQQDSASQSRLQLTDLETWKKALGSCRPVLAHLNADTTWLVQLPLPRAERSAGRTTYNILIDPWLRGPQSDVASWFSTQWHLVAPSVGSMAELNAVLGQLEGGGAPSPSAEGGGQKRGGAQTPYTGKSYIDAVAISHEFTDHCHRATLEELPRGTPVFATEKAASLIRSWSHFDRVTTTPGFTGQEKSWQDALGDKNGALPAWLGIGRVVTPGNALYYHSAVVIAFELDAPEGSPKGKPEAILYSPHGIESSDLECAAGSGLETLALLHGLHDVQIWMTKQLNLGGLNGIKAARACGAKYWIATHDEVKKGGGLIARFLRRKVYSAQDAVESLPAGNDEKFKGEFLELDSGEAIILEA